MILGCRQQYEVDFQETFAPVAKMTKVKAFLTVIAMKEWYAYQMDVSNALLHGDLEEEVYVTFPQGYTTHGEDISFDSSSIPALVRQRKLICKRNKSLYELKQALRQ